MLLYLPQIQFQTPAGTYLRQAVGSRFLEITDDGSDPRTVFAVSYASRATPTAVPMFYTFFRCVATGLYITEDGNQGPQLYTTNPQVRALQSASCGVMCE